MVNEKIKAAEENLIHVYNRFPIALERGEGVYLYDTNGEKISGFCSRICSVGTGIRKSEAECGIKIPDRSAVSYVQPVLSYQCGEAAQKTEPDFGDGPGIFYEQRV